MKEYKGCGGKAPYIPDLRTVCSALTVAKELVVSLGSEAGSQMGAVAKINPRPEIERQLPARSLPLCWLNYHGLRSYYWGLEVCYELQVTDIKHSDLQLSFGDASTN
jgi:hypothetical protein